eukprot:6172458-Pleurochrysis_carterae.AAC.1
MPRGAESFGCGNGSQPSDGSCQRWDSSASPICSVARDMMFAGSRCETRARCARPRADRRAARSRQRERRFRRCLHLFRHDACLPRHYVYRVRHRVCLFCQHVGWSRHCVRRFGHFACLFRRGVGLSRESPSGPRGTNDDRQLPRRHTGQAALCRGTRQTEVSRRNRSDRMLPRSVDDGVSEGDNEGVREGAGHAGLRNAAPSVEEHRRKPRRRHRRTEVSTTDTAAVSAMHVAIASASAYASTAAGTIAAAVAASPFVAAAMQMPLIFICVRKRSVPQKPLFSRCHHVRRHVDRLGPTRAEGGIRVRRRHLTIALCSRHCANT